MKIDENYLRKSLTESLKINNIDEAFRLFHGRSNQYPPLRGMIIDFYPPFAVLFLYDQFDEELLADVKEILFKVFKNLEVQCNDILIQDRFNKNYKFIDSNAKSFENELIVKELGAKYILNFSNNQNLGLFPDMREGKTLIKDIVKDKTILNLFAYTCSFSVFSLLNGAKKVTNLDMAKSILSRGMKNHHINNISNDLAKFLPFNFWKYLPRLKKMGPFDLVIADPPSFQKNSFETRRHYPKLLKSIKSLTHDNSYALICLNDPKENWNFLESQIKEYFPDFVEIQRCGRPKYYKENDPDKDLKIILIKVTGNE